MSRLSKKDSNARTIGEGDEVKADGKQIAAWSDDGCVAGSFEGH